MDQFVGFYSNNLIAGDDRSSTLEVMTQEENHVAGIIHYGSFGIAADIVDGQTSEVKTRRERTDVERIPLFFLLYTPSGEDTWYMATQSFGGRSCSSTFNSHLRDFCQDHMNQQMMIQKVMPTSEDAYADQSIQKLTLIRRRVASEEFQQQIGELARELKVSLSVSVDGRGALGSYESIRDWIAEREDAALTYDGIEFDEINATVRIGSSYRKVALIGPSNVAGVIDISDDVQRDGDEYPVYDSILNTALEVCNGMLIQYRDQ
ncbi:MAG: hypothetical protein AAFY75_03670 [Pseudomonadota bacterium]